MITTGHIKKPKGIWETMHEDGDTQDIIDVILYADKRAAKDTEAFAKLFNPTKRSLRDLWKFTRFNIGYLADRPGHEKVKSPAATNASKIADCKSKSIFIGSVCQNLGLKYDYRFIAYWDKYGKPAKNVTHVYVVVHLNGRKVPMDAVHTRFAEEVPYSWKKDYSGHELESIGSLPTPPQNYVVPILTFFGAVQIIKALQ